MLRPFLALLFMLLLAFPAAAHSLRVFARVEGGQVTGHAFFIGGGRPKGAQWSARMGEATLGEGRTDAGGAFAFAVPVPVTAGITVTVDTGEGHVASAHLAPERFGAGRASLAAGGIAAAPSAPPPVPAGALPVTAEAAIEKAVARQVAPLLERIEAMDARLRITDLVSGLFLIFGLAGMALWAMGRRR